MNFLNLLKTTSSNYYILRNTNDSILNGKNLIEKYNSLQNIDEKRFILFLEPGIYDLNGQSLILSKNYIDLIGIHELDKSIIKSDVSTINNGVINQIADNIKLGNLKILNTNISYINIWLTYNDILTEEERNFYFNLLSTVPSSYFRNIPNGQNLGNTNITNVDFDSLSNNISTMRIGTVYAGNYTDCTAKDFSFGFNSIILGSYNNCRGGSFAFGSKGIGVTAAFENCKASSNSFGSFASVLNGSFKDCVGGLNSFGIDSITNTATFTNCKILS